MTIKKLVKLLQSASTGFALTSECKSITSTLQLLSFDKFFEKSVNDKVRVWDLHSQVHIVIFVTVVI